MSNSEEEGEDYYGVGDSIRTAKWFDPIEQLRVASLEQNADGSIDLVNNVTGSRVTLGEDGVETDSVHTENLNTDRSFRVGDYVYYDPSNSGPYIDGADAYADVPPGGCLFLADGLYDVDVEGPLHTTLPKTIQGVGEARNADDTLHGTLLEADSTDAPIVEFDSGTDRHEGGGMHGVSIKQKTSTTHPVVRINNTIRTNLSDNYITCWGGNAPVGIKYEGTSFFARQHRNTVKGWSDRGISVEGSGYAYEFHETFVSSGVGTNSTALYTDTSRPVVIGGQYSAVGDGGCAIHFDATEAGGHNGGLILEPGIEDTPVPLRIGGDYEVNNVNAFFWAGHLNQTIDTVLDLVNSNYGYYRPGFNASVYDTSAGIALVDYGSGAIGNCIEVGSIPLRNMAINGTPSNADIIRVYGSAGNGALADYDTGTVRIICDFNHSVGAPVWHDTTEWREVSSTAFTP